MSITFYTGIKNRCEHLKQTLPKSLEAASGHSDVDFVILDYGSNDGLQEFMKEFVGHPKVTFYSLVNPPDFYYRCHAKNMAAKLSTAMIGL